MNWNIFQKEDFELGAIYSLEIFAVKKKTFLKNSFLIYLRV
jgi:hypothetical protein